jgi:hypothetical protein
MLRFMAHLAKNIFRCHSLAKKKNYVNKISGDDHLKGFASLPEEGIIGEAEKIADM